jgi:excinuclease ABC subunit A
MSLTHITVRGAREHNLKGVDISLPRDSLIVITGLSGSGKSSSPSTRSMPRASAAMSKAFGLCAPVSGDDAEARCGTYRRAEPRDQHRAEDHQPQSALDRGHGDRNLRLYAPAVGAGGVPYSPATGLPITAQTVSQMVDRVMALPEGTRAYLLAPAVRGRKGEYRKEIAEWQKAGYTRLRVDGELYAIEECPRSTRSTSMTSRWWSTASR